MVKLVMPSQARPPRQKAPHVARPEVVERCRELLVSRGERGLTGREAAKVLKVEGTMEVFFAMHILFDEKITKTEWQTVNLPERCQELRYFYNNIIEDISNV